MNEVDGLARSGEVPCDGCTLCCHGDAVRILEHEDPSRWATEPHPFLPGQRMLAHKQNGDCLYLATLPSGLQGCTIHQSKPQVCSEMDCRLVYSRIPFQQARKLHLVGALSLKVWRRGQELSCVKR